MHEAFRPYLTELRSQLSEGLDSTEVENAVCEIGAHLELAYEESIRQGRTHSEAYEKALLSLGLSSKQLAKDFGEHHHRAGVLASARTPLILSWLGALLYTVFLLFMPGLSQNLGLLFFPINSLPMFTYAMFMLSSYLHGRYRLLWIAVPHLVCYGTLFIYLSIRMAHLDFVVPYLVNIACLFVFGHIFMVFLRLNGSKSMRRRVAE